MEDYTSNSIKSKRNEVEKERKVEKVVRNEVKVKKKSGFSKFFSDFINGDMTSVKEYLIDEVLIPSVKSTLSDAISNGVDMLLYGESRGKRYSSNSGPKISYNSIYNKDPRNKVSYNNSKRDRVSIDEIILETRAEAEEVIAQMHSIIDDYGMVSVADLYETVGLDTSYTDNKYGWYELGAASIIRVREGFLLKLTKPVVLD